MNPCHLYGGSCKSAKPADAGSCLPGFQSLLMDMRLVDRQRRFVKFFSLTVLLIFIFLASCKTFVGYEVGLLFNRKGIATIHPKLHETINYCVCALILIRTSFRARNPGTQGGL